MNLRWLRAGSVEQCALLRAGWDEVGGGERSGVGVLGVKYLLPTWHRDKPLTLAQ